jgi:hypothetical protein
MYSYVVITIELRRRKDYINQLVDIRYYIRISIINIMGQILCCGGRRMHENPYEDDGYVNYDIQGNIHGNSLMRKSEPKDNYVKSYHLNPYEIT